MGDTRLDSLHQAPANATSRDGGDGAAIEGQEGAPSMLGPVATLGRGRLQRKLQRRLAERGRAAAENPDALHQAADQGTRGAGGALPHLDAIQRSFGRHDVSHVQAHTDAQAKTATAAIGAEAYASGDHVVFGRAPDLHTAAHEAAHVVQQRAGVHLKGGVGEAGDVYENNADAVADAVTKGESAQPLLDKAAPMSGSSGNRTVQRKLSPELDNQQKFTVELAKNNPDNIPAFKLFTWARKADETFGTITEVLAAYKKAQSARPPEKSPTAPMDSGPKSVVDQPKKEVVSPSKAPKKTAKQHSTVAEGASQLFINYVWLGRGQLDALAKYNIYSWRALGHAVTVYTHHFAEGTKHSVSTLGIEAGDATVVDILEHLNADNSATGEKNPKVALSDTRSILIRWLRNSQNPAKWPLIDDKKSPKHGQKDDKPSQDNRFNMIDLTKSYIGGTQRGIVLDTKVGPTTHLKDYENTIKDRFISYSRGGKAVRVENQCMGTMQESEDLRFTYATTFNSKVRTNLTDADPDKKHYDLITGYHADGHAAAGGVDTAVDGPTGERSTEYPVAEPGSPGHGPFRVFKNAGHQTNQGNEISDEEKARRAKDIKFLAKDVFRDELDPKKSHGDPAFLEKAKAAMGSMPET